MAEKLTVQIPCRCEDCEYAEEAKPVSVNFKDKIITWCRVYEVWKDIDGYCNEGEKKYE